MTRKVLFVALFAVLHTVGTAYVSIMAMGAALSGLEHGQAEASPRTIWFLGTVAEAMMLPLIPVFAPHGAPGQWGHALIFGNGVIWGATVLVLRAIVRRRAARRAASSATLHI